MAATHVYDNVRHVWKSVATGAESKALLNDTSSVMKADWEAFKVHLAKSDGWETYDTQRSNTYGWTQKAAQPTIIDAVGTQTKMELSGK